MLDQLFNIVRQTGEETVVNNSEVPNEYNNDVMAEATKTIASGFKNVMAGGGLENILDLFKGTGNTGSNNANSGIGSLLKNPMVTMMIGHFISKLVGKFNMSPASASNVANQLIPESLNNFIDQAKDGGNDKVDIDGFLGSLVGKQAATLAEENNNASNNGFSLQDLIGQFTGGGNNSGAGQYPGPDQPVHQTVPG